MSPAWQLAWTRGVGIHGAGWMVPGAIALWVALTPWLGRRSFRRLEAALGRGDAGARGRAYRRSSIQGWGVAAVVVAATVGGLGWTPARLGLRWPDSGRPFAITVLVVAVLGVAGGLALRTLRLRRRAPDAAPAPLPDVPAARLVPRTRQERRGFAVLAVTAGVTEEVVWRGALLAILVAILPRAPVIALVAVLALVFGAAHLYQGLRGMVGTTVIGALLAGIYVATGSLLPGMGVHAAIDLAMLLQVPAEDEDPHAPAAPPG